MTFVKLLKNINFIYAVAWSTLKATKNCYFIIFDNYFEMNDVYILFLSHPHFTTKKYLSSAFLPSLWNNYEHEWDFLTWNIGRNHIIVYLIKS